MKKTLLFFVFAILFMFSTGFAFGQCTPDPSVTDPEGNGEMSPDTIEVTELTPFSMFVTYICPDTAYIGGGGHVNLHHITIRSIPNKPAWLNFVCNPSNCEFPAGVAECILFTGTPPSGSAGYISLTVLVDVWNTIIGTPVCVTCTTYPNGYDGFMPMVVWVHPTGSTNPPIVSSPISYCQNETAVPLTATGTNLLWYTTPTGGTGSVTAPTPGTASVGTTVYYVSQTIGGIESSRASITVVVNPIPASPTVTSPITYYQNASANPLTASGSNLLWYTQPTGGIGSITAPTPSTANIGSTTYYVSQTVNGCESPRVPIFVNVIQACSASLPSTTGASRCGAGSVSLHASGGNMYIWYNAPAGGNIVNVGPSFNTPSLSTTTIYYVSNFDSCESARVPVTATVINLSVDAGNNQTISCGNSVMLNANTTYNGSNSLVYAWSPTTGLSSGTIHNPSANPLQTTAYAVMVSDGVCSSYDNITITVTPPNFGVDFSANQQLIYTPPFAVQFNNLTPSISNYNFTWHFGDGATLQSNNATVFHQYAQNGLYDVSLIATSISSGCSQTVFRDDWIFCAGGSNCTHTASVTPAGPISGCIGTPVVLTCNAVSGATYQWNYNGVAIAGNNANSFIASASGNYSVTIIVYGCPVTSNIVTVTLNNPPAVPTITATGSLTYCGGGSVLLEAPAGASSYLWSNGATTQNITVTTSGNYTVQVGDVNACVTQSLPYLVGSSPLGNPDICLVSVDSVTGHNVIIWNEPVTNAIDHFNIYGEGNQANVFNLLGTVNYSSLSIFTDNTANPMQQAYRYKISAVDTCGAETALSNYHKSIHLTINQGMGNTFNLIWSYYEGFTFSSYNIYRGTSPSNMTLLTTIASTLNSYTDLTPPVGNVYYQIEAVNPNPCTASKTSYYSTRSNIASSTTASINSYDNATTTFEIYPNPAEETITIEFNVYPNDNSFAEIFSVDGKLIQRFPILKKTTEINISSLHSGVYIIKISGNDGIGIKKLIIE